MPRRSLPEILVVREPPGVLCDRECYTASIGHYLYIADTLPELFLQIAQEWEHDKHFVGF